MGRQSTMGRPSVILLFVLFAVTVSQVWGGCYDYTCSYENGGPWSPNNPTVMDVDAGDRCNYDTQKGPRYPPPKGVSCIVDYKLGTCKKVKFECDSLNMRNKDDVPWRCNWGDKMIIYEHNNGYRIVPTRKYCRHRTPKRVKSVDGLKIKLYIERKTKGARGGRGCFIKCEDP